MFCHKPAQASNWNAAGPDLTDSNRRVFESFREGRLDSGDVSGFQHSYDTQRARQPGLHHHHGAMPDAIHRIHGRRRVVQDAAVIVVVVIDTGVEIDKVFKGNMRAQHFVAKLASEAITSAVASYFGQGLAHRPEL